MGRDWLREAREFPERNPDAWAHICAYMGREVEAGRKCSMRGAVEDARLKDYTASDGTPTRINHNIEAGLARLYLRAHPEAGPFVELRRSPVFDGPGGAWR